MAAPRRRAAATARAKIKARVSEKDVRGPRYPYLPCGYEVGRREEYLSWLRQAEAGGETETPDACEERFSILLGVWAGFTLTNPIDWFPVYEDLKAGDIAVLRLSDSYAPDWVRDGRTRRVCVDPGSLIATPPSPSLPRDSDLDRLLESAALVLDPPRSPPDRPDHKSGWKKEVFDYELPPHEIFAESATVFGLGPIGLGLVLADAALDPSDGHHHAPIGMFLPFPVELLDGLLDPSHHVGEWFEGFATTEREGLPCPIRTSVPDREGKQEFAYLTESEFRRFVFWIGEEFDPDGWFAANLAKLEKAAEALRGGGNPTSIGRDELWDRFLRTCRPGDYLEGTVTKIVEFGAFVDLAEDFSGIEGLVHISELSEEWVEDPSELVEVGQSVQVMILEIDAEHQRVVLSMKSGGKIPSTLPGTWRLKSPLQGGEVMSLWVAPMLRLGDRERGLRGLARLGGRSDLGKWKGKLRYAIERFSAETETAAREAAQAILSVNLTGRLPDDRFPNGGEALVSVAPHQMVSVRKVMMALDFAPVIPYRTDPFEIGKEETSPTQPPGAALKEYFSDLPADRRYRELWGSRREFEWMGVHDDLAQIYLGWMRGVIAKNPSSLPGIFTIPIHGSYDQELNQVFWDSWQAVGLSDGVTPPDEALSRVANDVLLPAWDRTDNFRPFDQCVYSAWWNNPLHEMAQTRLVPVTPRQALACWEAAFSLFWKPLKYVVSEPLYFPDEDFRPGWMDDLGSVSEGMTDVEVLDRLDPSPAEVRDSLSSLLQRARM